MKNKFNYLLIICLGLFLGSCASKSDLVYFAEAAKEPLNDSLFMSQAPRFKSGDLLTINVSASELEAVVPFNLPVTPFAANGQMLSTNAQTVLQTYLVDNRGSIEFPVLGEIKISGMTRMQATEYLREQISAYVSNPIVNIRITNFTVSVLGSVASPGNFQVNDERITVLEALSMAGDAQIYGERHDVKVLRDINGKQEFFTVDLTSEEVVNSPVYYLQQNDVVYVSPNQPQVNSSRYSPSYGIFIAVTGIVISVITLISK
jgi:polysaccharide export outer membrane protein